MLTSRPGGRPVYALRAVKLIGSVTGCLPLLTVSRCWYAACHAPKMLAAPEVWTWRADWPRPAVPFIFGSRHHTTGAERRLD